MNLLIGITALAMSLAVWAWLVSWILSDFFAKGTHGRYVCRTVQRPTQWMAGMFYLVYTPYKFQQHDWFWAVLYLFATYACLKSIWDFYHPDDEDDMWKRGKKKIKKLARAAKRRARALKPRVLVPVSAGGAA
jgi:myo-inositol catabolism protein IolC